MSNEAPQTLKYLGTDNHSKKLMEGKFSSNVQPRNFGKGQKREPWVCPDCSRENREYLMKCWTCGHPREG